MKTFDLDPVELMPVGRELREQRRQAAERAAAFARDARLPPALRRVVAPEVATALEQLDDGEADEA